MMRPTSVSIIICTRNRAASLSRTLRSIQNIEVVKDCALEIIVVDNGSTDGTREVAESYGRNMPIRLIREEIGGLSVARNTGVKHATGEIILWTDDDVEVDRFWLKACVECFYKFPELAVLGGKALPKFQEPSTAWFVAAAPYLYDLLAIRDFPGEAIPLSFNDGILPYGLNYAVKREVQEKFLYNPLLGVAPGRRTGGEEIDVIKRILNNNFQGMYYSKSLVYHCIPPHRQTKDYIYEYYHSAGKQRAEAEIKLYQEADSKFSILRYIPRLLVKLSILSAAYFITKSISIKLWVPAYARLAFNKGQIEEWLRRKSFSK